MQYNQTSTLRLYKLDPFNLRVMWRGDEVVAEWLSHIHVYSAMLSVEDTMFWIQYKVGETHTS